MSMEGEQKNSQEGESQENLNLFPQEFGNQSGFQAQPIDQELQGVSVPPTGQAPLPLFGGIQADKVQMQGALMQIAGGKYMGQGSHQKPGMAGASMFAQGQVHQGVQKEVYRGIFGGQGTVQNQGKSVNIQG